MSNSSLLNSIMLSFRHMKNSFKWSGNSEDSLRIAGGHNTNYFPPRRESPATQDSNLEVNLSVRRVKNGRAGH